MFSRFGTRHLNGVTRAGRRRLPRGRALVSAAVLVSVAACGSGDTGTPNAFGTPTSGGALRLALIADPPALDPFTASNFAVAWGNLLSAIYDPLVWSDPTTGAVRPHLAESLTPDNTARVWTLTLRPGVEFSDGAPFDAAAVKANWELHADPKTGSAYAAGAVGLKLTVSDALHLVIELPSPNANFDRAVASGLNYIASPRALGDLTALRTHPVGAGPFVLAGRDPGKSLTLRRNPRYWQPGRPYLDEIDAQVQLPGRTVPDAIDAGDADLGEVTDPAVEKAAKKAGLGLVSLNLNGGLMVVFNTRKAPFNDPAARQAVVDSMSANEINDRFHQGAGTPAHGIFDSTSPLANIQLAPRENDPEKARAAFDRLTSGGTRPFVFSFMTTGSTPGTLEEETLYMQQQVQRFPGVTMRAESVDVATLTRRLIAGDFDMALSALWMNDPEPNLFDFLRPGSPANLTGYTNPVVTEAMNAARLTTQTDQRYDAYLRAQVQLNKDLPFWVYQEAVNDVVFGPRVTGVEVLGDGVLLFDRVGFRR
ncbi:ABC transporter substrate-binding protein [Yinghuangia seranimata]|uniref:ABC transporter substrate-binding protein n=1 Tax=Yinghuangia seranimata TaxID=408067 RepID=UPI00248B6369|nr:ABC transporter substrate-binding protein [Yinghuangia seranimata]MDI2129416.1 ABC transporter substrate-binding protein [Yinghuangia seranimata]